MNAPAPMALVRLMQLVSPALPVGAYTYSQGLEWAVESGRIRNETSAGEWIGDLMQHCIGRFEAPLVAALMQHWASGNTKEMAQFALSKDEATRGWQKRALRQD